MKHNSPPDYIFLSLIGVLVLFGLIILSSASSVIAYEKFGSSFYLIKHQILYGLLPGLVLLAFTLRVPYQTWRKLALPILLLTLTLLVLVIIPGVGRKLGGARSWFTIGTLSFQPSEFAKLGLIIYLAAWFESKQTVLADFRKGFLPFVGIVGLAGLLIILQPDLGTLGIVGLIVLFLAFTTQLRLLHLGGAVVAGIMLTALLVWVAPYRVARLTTFAHPELDPQGIGYHINQALITVGSGGLFGVGFGNSRQKFRYLPEVASDSIFPIMAEELGFVLSAGFIVLILVLILRMFRLARDAPDPFAKMVVLGIAGWFGLQSFVNIGSMLGLLPLTGLPLPFVSYGGTALAIELAAVGIVGSISRTARS